MSANRDKERDRVITRQMILDSNRPTYSGGKNWLGHGPRDGKNAVIDYLLLDGAPMKRLLEERSTDASIRSHFQHLKADHGLPISHGSNGKYSFDKDSLAIPKLSGKTVNPTEFRLPEEIVKTKELMEGAFRSITVNAYERNPDARRRCIAHYGPICAVCNFDFATAYGSFAEGFIHVHHLKPLSDIGKEYQVDPIGDLRPV
jgi:hypothetical protein